MRLERDFKVCSVKRNIQVILNYRRDKSITLYLYEICKRISTMNENGEVKTLDRLKQLYPNVATEPLPLSWSSTEKNNSIGLSNANLRVHYKGKHKKNIDKIFPQNFLFQQKKNIKKMIKKTHKLII